MLKPHVLQFHFGLKKPVKILHLTDPHLSFALESEPEEWQKNAALRRNVFFNEAEFPERDPVGYLEEAMEYSKNFDCTVITGDLIDLSFQGSIRQAERILAGKDFMFTPGNHELCRARTPLTFENRDEVFLDGLRHVFPRNMHFESRIVGGVNVVAVDNSMIIWTQEQFDALMTEIAKGLPILLFCHCPLTDVMLTLEGEERRNRYFNMGATREMIDLTCRAMNIIADEPLIKASFAGHYHYTGTEHIKEKTSYILGGLFKGIVGEIIID
ncbi:MAG: metallophosphoesterase [Clostridia bacterium]|nr:metallophosphoesterase [Clostridia bacterium]